LTLAEAQALAEYPNPEVYFKAVGERRRRERLDYMIDTAIAVRAASATSQGFREWLSGLQAERRRVPDEAPKTVFEMMKGVRGETVFDQMKRRKNGGA